MLAPPKAPQTARRALRFSPTFKSCRYPQQCVLSRRSPVQIADAEKKFKPGAFCQSNRKLQIGWVPCDADNLPIHDQLQRELAKENPLLQILLLRQTIDHNQKFESCRPSQPVKRILVGFQPPRIGPDFSMGYMRSCWDLAILCADFSDKMGLRAMHFSGGPFPRHADVCGLIDGGVPVR